MSVRRWSTCILARAGPLPRRLGLLTQGTLEGGFLSGWFTEAGVWSTWASLAAAEKTSFTLRE